MKKIYIKQLNKDHPEYKNIGTFIFFMSNKYLLKISN